LRLRQRPLLLAEALAALVIASLLIGLFSFNHVSRFARSQKNVQKQVIDPAEAQQIARALDAFGRYTPWKTMCFQKGLAAHFMLRRRSVASTLFYGARHDENGALVAHVWVKSGQIDVIGCAEAEGFSLLAEFQS
jgi:hypothetical protein